MSASLTHSSAGVLAVVDHEGMTATLKRDVDRAAGYAMAEKAEATRKAYRTDFALFQQWATHRGVRALPATPETVAAFLAAEAERGTKPATISRRVAAIRYAHRPGGAAGPH